jgi:hypothetical protein
MSSYRKMSTTELKHQFHRLNWAAATTDDPQWAKQHRRQAALVQSILKERGVTVEALQ